jgi:hypothetical protein
MARSCNQNSLVVDVKKYIIPERLMRIREMVEEYGLFASFFNTFVKKNLSKKKKRVYTRIISEQGTLTEIFFLRTIYVRYKLVVSEI